MIALLLACIGAPADLDPPASTVGSEPAPPCEVPLRVGLLGVGNTQQLAILSGAP